MTDFTTLTLYSNSKDGQRLDVDIRVRQLNATEYDELFTAVRHLQKVTDKYIYGAPVIRPDENNDPDTQG
jgi:hypothetical protein